MIAMGERLAKKVRVAWEVNDGAGGVGRFVSADCWWKGGSQRGGSERQDRGRIGRYWMRGRMERRA